ncbi:MAG: ATP-binding protein, partial [Pseudomonadota bacterium]
MRRRLAADVSTQRERAAEEEAIIDALPDPLLLLDGERRIQRANAAARSEFGDDVEGRTLSAVLRQPGLLDAAERAATHDESRIIEVATPGPIPRHFSVKVQPSPGGADAAVIVSLSDVTALKQNDRMRSDFVANASHELRTPLSSLIGFIETLQGPARGDADARERFLAIMRDQAGRMARLVDGLMNLSKIETTEHVAPSAEVDLVETARAVAATLEFRARERGMAITLDLAGEPVAILGDADDIADLIRNLIENAIKYGRDGGLVRVSVQRLSDGDPRLPRSAQFGAACIAVTDDGAGIAPEHIPRLTERFYRVDEARSRELGGVGLGLSIVKHIVNRHR